MIRRAPTHQSGGVFPSLLQAVNVASENSVMFPSRRSPREAVMRELSRVTTDSDCTKPSRKSSVSV